MAQSVYLRALVDKVYKEVPDHLASDHESGIRVTFASEFRRLSSALTVLSLVESTNEGKRSCCRTPTVRILAVGRRPATAAATTRTATKWIDFEVVK